MKKIYDKNEVNFSLIWIALYVVLFSVAESVSKSIGTVKLVTAPLCIVMSAVIYLWISKNNLKEKYGLCGYEGTAKQYLFFIPLAVFASVNLWHGGKMNFSVLETALYIISMMGAGFLEEIIFRGFLFKAICKDSLNCAVVISSITFGVGHIVNLLNGANIQETMLQICYAAAIGFLFSILFYIGKSLWPCIITHSMMNSLSAFANKDAVSGSHSGLVTCVILCVVSIGYALYIIKTAKPRNSQGQ